MLPFISPILDIISKVIPDKDKQAELQKAILENKDKIESHFVEYAKIDAEIRMKEMEMTGFKSWWSPLLSLSFGLFLVAFCVLYYILPAIVVYLNLNVYIPQAPEVDSNIWDIILYVILGISGMRTIDKWKK